MITKKTLKIIIPVVAVLVVAESLILVNSLSRKETAAPVAENGLETVTTIPSQKETVTLRLVAGEGEAVSGQENYVEVTATSRERKALDAISLYVLADTNLVELDRVETDNDLPKPIVAKISKTGEMAIVNYLISSAAGYQLETGAEVKIARIYYIPKAEGRAEFKILNADSGESETMLVETGTSEVIPFNSNNLSVSILK